MIYGSFPLGSTPLASLLTQVIQGLIVTIGPKKIEKISPGSLRVTDKLNSRDTASLNIVDINNDIDIDTGERIFIELDGVRIFGGTIDSVNRKFPKTGENTKLANISLKAVDFNQILDRFLIARNFEVPNQTLGDIVKSIIDQELKGEGLGTDFVQDGSEIAKVIFNYLKTSSCFDELATLTGFFWYIDYFKNVHFAARGDEGAPITITDINCKYLGLSIRKGRGQYRNRQFLRAGKDETDTRTESFVGDGERETFTLGFEVGTMVEIRLNSVVQTFGIRSVDTDKDWFFKRENEQITQGDANSGLPLEDTDILEVDFRGLFPIIVRSDDLSQIQKRKDIEGGTGIYEDRDSDQNIDSLALADEKISGILRRDAKIHDILSFQQDNAGVRSGQLLPVNLTRENINGEFLITSVTFSDLGDGSFTQFRYSVMAVSGEHLGGWVEFFKKLIDKGRPFVIRPNEVLITLTKFFETLNLAQVFDTTSLIDDGTNDPYTGARLRVNDDPVFYPVEKWYTIGKSNVGKKP